MRPLRRRDLYWKGSATGQRSRVMSDVYDSSAMPAKPTLYAGADIRRVWYLSEQHRNWCKYFQTELEQIELRNIANDHNQGETGHAQSAHCPRSAGLLRPRHCSWRGARQEKARVRQEAPT